MGVENKQLTTDNSANASGSQSVWLSGSGDHDLDQRSGYVEGDSKTGNVAGSGNLFLGSGATYVEDLGADVAQSAFSFGGKAVDANAAALKESLGFGTEALKLLSGFGLGSIESANRRADNAVSAVERLAAVPTDRNAAPPTPLNKNLVIGLSLGAAVLGLFVWKSRKKKD